MDCVVLYYPLEEESIDGCHIEKPVNGHMEQFVFINSNNTRERQAFSAAHELGHIWQVDKRLEKKVPDIEFDSEVAVSYTHLNIYVGLIQDEAQDIPSVREFSLLSEQELDRIETLVQNLLKMTKLDAGTIVMEKSFEPVCELVESVKNLFRFRAGQEGKEIRLSGDREVTLYCDRTWIVEAVSNLVKNALDHTESGGTISIEWVAFASVIQITVRDNGSGIHPEDLHHIFKRFYRSRFSKDKQGIGLGLPLTKAIVEIHGGTIEVESETGVGSSFTMNFLIPTNLLADCNMRVGF